MFSNVGWFPNAENSIKNKGGVIYSCNNNHNHSTYQRKVSLLSDHLPFNHQFVKYLLCPMLMLEYIYTYMFKS